jgi:hypothetical protein
MGKIIPPPLKVVGGEVCYWVLSMMASHLSAERMNPNVKLKLAIYHDTIKKPY